MEVVYKENESVTYEIIATHKDSQGAPTRRVIYRLWEVGDGDWKIHIIEDDDIVPFAILLPKKVIDKIINVTVKDELKH